MSSSPENTQNLRKQNFRASYYEKVGFRGVDNTKSLEIILNEKPFNLAKLECFCQKSTIPGILREKVWMLLLGLITPDGEYEEFILQEQRILCQDLLRPLYVLGFLDENTPSARKFTLMYLLNQGSLSINTCEQINDSEKRNLLAIASVFCDLSPMFENTFWLFKEFVLKLKRTQISLPDVKSELRSELQLKQPDLDSHLSTINAYDALPLSFWCERCFAGILDPDAVFKIWDKVVSGSYVRIFPAICKYLMITLRSEIMELNQASAVKNLLIQPIIHLDPVKFDGIINISVTCLCSDANGNKQ